jgi:heavy metal translocating P-type ATPase
MRVQMAQPHMSLRQADQLESYLQGVACIWQVTVHERTRCVIVEYRAADAPGRQAVRAQILRALSAFAYNAEQLREAQLAIQNGESAQSGRALNRAYEEKMVGMVCFKALRSLFLPAPLRMVYTIWQAVPYLVRGVKSLVRGKLHVEVLDGLSIGISLVRMDFDTAGSVVFLLKLGELLEEWTHKKSVDDLARCMSLNVDQVWLQTPAGDVLVPLAQVKAGDCISLRMGSMVPLDGVIESGSVMLNQASLTGESLPVPKSEGMTVYAGTVVEEGACALRVTQLSGSSRYDKIVAMIEQSEKLKSSAENQASNLADKLVPYTLLGSAATYLFTRNVTRALSVLMVDFSCALKLAMPLAVLSAMREAGQYHITVKGGKYLEAMAQADTIIFDKTGTLTHACPVVARVIPFGGRDEQEMLRLAACLEEHFPHSMANAVVQEARRRALLHEEMHSEVEYIVAHGIASVVDEQRVVIGNAHFVFEDEGCAIPAGETERFDALPSEYSHLYLAIGGVLAAVICIADPLRSEAKAVVEAMHRLGIRKTVMLTGDSKRTAAAVAAQVGVDEYHAEVLPEDKAHFVDEEHKLGHKVIMLGDGINDAPALSAADVGIAISDGAAIAREIADITVAADDLFELVVLRRIAAGLMHRIRANYRFVISFNSGLIVLGAAGLLPPSTSALLHNFSTLCISLHSMKQTPIAPLP